MDDCILTEFESAMLESQAFDKNCSTACSKVSEIAAQERDTIDAKYRMRRTQKKMYPPKKWDKVAANSAGLLEESFHWQEPQKL